MAYNVPALSVNTVSNYISSVFAIPNLSREEEIELFKKYREEGDNNAARSIVMANLKLVVNLAYKFRKFRDSIDLIQEGNMGLMTAVKRFDIDKGVRFATYAVWWIKAKIQEFIISHMSIVRFGKSRDERKLFFNLASTIREIEKYESGKNLSEDELIEEISRRIQVEPSMIKQNLRLLRSTSDLSLSVSYDGEGEKSLQLRDETDHESEVIEADLNEKRNNAFKEAFESLSEREQFVIRNRRLTENPLTLGDIGDLWSVSKERVRQIESRAIEKMKRFVTDCCQV